MICYFQLLTGMMVPSQAVLGYVDTAGTPFVASYDINSYSPSSWQLLGALDGWAQALGVMQATNGSNGSRTTVICFSTDLTAPISGLQQVFKKSWRGNGHCKTVWHQPYRIST